MDVQPLFDDLLLWPMARRNYEALQDVAMRQLEDGITLMFNPARVRSTAAAVDVESVRRRPCFLCRANRPCLGETMTSWSTRFPFSVTTSP